MKVSSTTTVVRVEKDTGARCDYYGDTSTGKRKDRALCMRLCHLIQTSGVLYFTLCAGCPVLGLVIPFFDILSSVFRLSLPFRSSTEDKHIYSSPLQQNQELAAISLIYYQEMDRPSYPLNSTEGHGECWTD